jgi:hypothetical protein
MCILFFQQLIPTFVEIFHHNPHQHIEYNEASQQKKCDKIQNIPLGMISLWLFINLYDINARVHYGNPSISCRKHKKRQQCLKSKMIVTLDFSLRSEFYQTGGNVKH